MIRRSTYIPPVNKPVEGILNALALLTIPYLIGGVVVVVLVVSR